jgi:triacylglycerol lipase
MTRQIHFQKIALFLALSGLFGAACGDVTPLHEARGGSEAIVRDADALDPDPQITPIFETYLVENNPTPLGEAPPWPVILVHGFSGFNRLGPLEYFFGVVDAWQDAGVEVFAPALPPYGGSPSRAEALAFFIDGVLEETGAHKVHLIAHSQGGVDSRRVISELGYGDRIATLTTVATPHQGTPLADYAEALPNGSLDHLGQLLAWLIGAVDDPPNETGGVGWNSTMAGAVATLTTTGMAHFNATHPDDPRVLYFSVAGVSNLIRADDICETSQWGALSRVDAVDPLLLGSGALLSGINVFSPRPNDGIVPSQSMVWGTFMGCIPADHFDEVGQIADLLPGVISGFSHRDFYDTLLAQIRALEPGLHP